MRDSNNKSQPDTAGITFVSCEWRGGKPSSWKKSEGSGQTAGNSSSTTLATVPPRSNLLLGAPKSLWGWNLDFYKADKL